MVLISSCSSDDDKANVILPKTIKYTSIQFPSDNSSYVSTYNGNKIVSVKDEAGRTDYTYDGDLIVKEVNYDTESGKDIISDIVTYKYANGKLAESMYAEGFSTEYPNGEYQSRDVYTHNADGTIKKEQYRKNTETGNEEKSMYSELLTYANGNLIKSVETNTENAYTFTAVYEYDNKNNPLKNILGFNLLVGHSEGEGSISSVNNVVKYTASYTSTASTNVYKREIVYDANDYPSKITQYRNDGTTVSEINDYVY